MTVDRDEAAALIEDLRSGLTLPSRCYTDPAITEQEQRLIFARSWAYVGPLSDLRNTGDYVTGQIGGLIPVVVVRAEAGLNAFVNICRHRRHEVMRGRGNTRAMQCPYHAWTYGLDGCLRAAPRAAAETGFQPEAYPLLPLRVEVLGPWVFVNADPAADPLATRYGRVLDDIAASGVDAGALELYRRETWSTHSNWKTVLENYLECYHCAVAHPGFSAAIDVRPKAYELTARGWVSSQAGMVRPSALEGRGRPGLYDVDGAVRQAQFHLLFPNTTININPGFPNLSIDVWWPDGPNGTAGFSEQYFAPGVPAGFADDLVAFNRQVGLEDDALTDSVQRGLRAGLVDRGRFLTGAEHLVGHFQAMVVHMLAGDPEAGLPAAPEVSSSSATA